MTDAYMQYEHEPTGTIARWHGGAYIELGSIATQDTGPFNNLGQPSYEEGEFMAVEVINVWDYATDEPTIPRTLDALEQAVSDHFDRTDDEDE